MTSRACCDVTRVMQREMEREQKRVKDLELKNEQQKRVLKIKTQEVSAMQKKLRNGQQPNTKYVSLSQSCTLPKIKLNINSLYYHQLPHSISFFSSSTNNALPELPLSIFSLEIIIIVVNIENVSCMFVLYPENYENSDLHVRK